MDAGGVQAGDAGVGGEMAAGGRRSAIRQKVAPEASPPSATAQTIVIFHVAGSRQRMRLRIAAAKIEIVMSESGQPMTKNASAK